MTATPYTDSIATTLGIDTDQLEALHQAHGPGSGIGQCAATLMTTLWEMEAAERDAVRTVADLTAQAQDQAGHLAGNGRTFDPSWLVTYANRANAAGAKLTAGTERLRMFKRLLDALTAPLAA